ncbi:hypothetical protein ACKVEX_14270 [Rhodocyclaceae bacterium SMB388]
MKHSSMLATLAALALLTAGTAQSTGTNAVSVKADGEKSIRVSSDGQLDFDLTSGDYVCEWGLRVRVERELTAGKQIQIGWNGGRYQLERDPSFSGLPRFEDRANGLVWIDLPWKGVLLDGKTYKPLANDCKTA